MGLKFLRNRSVFKQDYKKLKEDGKGANPCAVLSLSYEIIRPHISNSSFTNEEWWPLLDLSLSLSGVTVSFSTFRNIGPRHCYQRLTVPYNVLACEKFSTGQHALGQGGQLLAPRG